MFVWTRPVVAATAATPTARAPAVGVGVGIVVADGRRNFLGTFPEEKEKVARGGVIARLLEYPGYTVHGYQVGRGPRDAERGDRGWKRVQGFAGIDLSLTLLYGIIALVGPLTMHIFIDGALRRAYCYLSHHGLVCALDGAFCHVFNGKEGRNEGRMKKSPREESMNKLVKARAGEVNARTNERKSGLIP